MKLSKRAMQRWLFAAGVYNIVWGAWTIFFPNMLFDLTGAARPSYPELWQCIGMIVGVYGVGYLAATSDPLRHWPIVLVGLMGKVFGPIGFVQAVIQGRFPPEFGLTILTNDLIWWIPFFLILRSALLQASEPKVPSNTSLQETLTLMRCERGQCSVSDLARERTILLVFLRHHGCTFCREAIADLSTLSRSKGEQSVTIVLVTTGSEQGLLETTGCYGLEEFDYVLDPYGKWYREFSLQRGTLGTLCGVSELKRALGGAFWRHGVGFLDGDGFQLSGAFVVRNGEVVSEYRHTRASDRPQYCELVER